MASDRHPHAALNAGRHLTDEQWLALMGLVSDDHLGTVRFPERNGAPARVELPERTIIVHADGRQEDE